MSEWWTYHLSSFLLFSPHTYGRLIERYNAAIWPWQLAGLAAGLAIGVRARPSIGRGDADRPAASLGVLALGRRRFPVPPLRDDQLGGDRIRLGLRRRGRGARAGGRRGHPADRTSRSRDGGASGSLCSGSRSPSSPSPRRCSAAVGAGPKSSAPCPTRRRSRRWGSCSSSAAGDAGSRWSFPFSGASRPGSRSSP